MGPRYVVEVWMSGQPVPSGSIEGGGFIQLVNQTANDVIRDQTARMKRRQAIAEHSRGLMLVV